MYFAFYNIAVVSSRDNILGENCVNVCDRACMQWGKYYRKPTVMEDIPEVYTI